MYDVLFLSLYIHVMNEGISRQIRCVWDSQKQCPTFLVLMQKFNIVWRERGRERRKGGWEVGEG